MIDKISIIFQYFIGILGAIIITPFVLAYYSVQLFWKIFGMSILGFLTIGFFGGTIEESMTYGASLGFFIGVLLKFRDLKKD